MNPMAPELAALVDEMMAILDEEIGLLDGRRGQLEGLSGAILDRDEDAMEKLLCEMERTLRVQKTVDSKLEALRNTLADTLGCPPKELKLSALIGRLQGQRRAALEYRRQQIVVLTDKLRRQHLETCLFLLESSRINRMLLESLFPDSEPVITYGVEGADQWRPDTGLVDAEL